MYGLLNVVDSYGWERAGVGGGLGGGGVKGGGGGEHERSRQEKGHGVGG